MPSTNFIQFNPGQSNQESDSAYQADALRSGGAPLNAIFQSVLANKIFYQLSTFVTAFANMLVLKGFSPSDVSLPALTAVLANVLTTADTQASLYAVPASTNPVFDRSKGQNQQFSMSAGSTTGGQLKGFSPGQTIGFIIITGANPVSFVWPTAQGGTLVNPPDMSNLATNTTYIQQYLVRSDNFIFPITPMMQYP